MDISWTMRRIETPRAPTSPMPLNRSKSTPAAERRFVAELYLNPKLEKYLRTNVSSALIDLSYCSLTDSDMSIIVKKIFPSDRNDRILDLSGNRFTSQGAAVLATHLIKCPSLKMLDLSFNRLSDAGIRPLADLLSRNPPLSLRKLFLNKNGISNDGARCLANLLQTNQTLEELWLSDNEIGNAGVQHLAHVLAYCNKSLKVLVLSSNIFITDSSINSIVKALTYNQTLEKLFLRDCNFTEKGKDVLSNRARPKRNFHLDI